MSENLVRRGNKLFCVFDIKRVNGLPILIAAGLFCPKSHNVYVRFDIDAKIMYYEYGKWVYKFETRR